MRLYVDATSHIVHQFLIRQQVRKQPRRPAPSFPPGARSSL